MSKIMLIDAAHAEETRVAVVDGHRVDEFDFESRAVKQLRGNIYLAKVTRVEPSLQAAFIEYGGNRHGFLAFDEIHPDYYQIPMADRAALMRDLESGHDDAGHDDSDIDADSEDEGDAEQERRKRRLLRRYKIQEVIKRRQIMLVQVVKEERGNKGAALTTYLSLAGRYCVLMPNTARGGGISRKITTATDRKRLKSAAASLDLPQGMGLIIRTAGAKRTKAEIKRDYDYLMRMWESIRDTTMNSIAPAQIYEEEDLVKRAIRDLYDKELDGIVVEGEEGYREAKEIMRLLMPSQAKKITPHRDPTPLFVQYGVEAQLEQIHSPVVPLPSGGYLVINQTEALVAIDVNSGRSTKERNVENTALKTNMEAASEAARQLRLRDLAGLIVIDFIDMDESKNNRAVEKELKDCLADDRARVQMGKISSFGLMEISRQRRRSGVLEGTTHICPHCSGLGRMRSVESSALAALRALQIEAGRGGAGALTLRVATPVGLYILNEKRAWLALLEESAGVSVTIAVDSNMPMADPIVERAAVVDGEEPRVSFQAPPPRARAPVKPVVYVDDGADDAVEDDVDEEDVESEADADEPVRAAAPAARSERTETQDDGTRGGRSRRRRRGGRGARDDAPVDRAPAEPSEDRPATAFAEESEEDGAHRRRRGRRGGRRTREESGPRDPYVWFRPRLADASDVYAWTDPHAPRVAPAPAGAETPEPVEVEAEAPVALATDTPERAPRRSRARRPRRGERPGDTAPDASVSVEAEAEALSQEAYILPELELPSAAVSDDAEPLPEPAVEMPDVEPEPEREPEAVIASEPEPAAPPELQPEPVVVTPDPAEISTPPAQAKRGWWRKGR